MQNFVASVGMAAISIPVSFFLARCCLRGFIRVVSGRTHRNVL
jgi:hypothetical protein